jgi:hypothetical protein
VKLTADGLACWAIDEATGRLFKFNLATGAELTTVQPYGLPGTLVQMAIYQPAGVTTPGGDVCVLEAPSSNCWSGGTPSAPCVGAQPTVPPASHCWTGTPPDLSRLPVELNE